MNIKFKIIFFTIVVLLGLRGIVMYSEVEHEKKHYNEQIAQQTDFINRLVKEKREFIFNRYSMRLNNIIKYTNLIKYLKNNDTQKLQKLMINRLQALHSEDKAVKTLHLIDKNNITIFRAHKPDMIADDLSDIRAVVVQTNKDKKIHSGHEAGVNDINYRIDVPIISDGIHYGVIEIGLDLTVIAKKIESIFANNYVLVMLGKQMISEFKPKHKLQELDECMVFYKNKSLNISNLDLSKEHAIIDGRHYHININNNLYTYDNKIIGKMVYLSDVTTYAQELEASKYFLIYQTIIIISLISILLYISFTYYENQINKEVEKNRQKDNMLLQQSKLAIMGEMISMIAHQWRQPLSTINMIVQSLIFKSTLGELKPNEMEKELNDVKDISLEMNSTIDDFKNFFKPTKERVVVSIKECIDDSIRLISALLKNNNIDVSIECKEEIRAEIFDREFKQVVINVLNNAKDALLENNQDNNRKIYIDISKNSTNAIITIEDNAGGIPSEILDKVFDPYFSTKSKNGTGLGLYMSKIIIDEHLEGNLSVKNSDNGAIFKIIIPIH
jgi:signal transduction histidine kinase